MKQNDNMVAAEENRTINMQFRVNEQELERIERRMQHIGTMNRSGFLRKMALNGECIVVDVKEMREAGRLLSYISNNMNQYAKKASLVSRVALNSTK